MNEYSSVKRSSDMSSPFMRNMDEYYSVEIPIIALGVIYQFKIWQINSIFMSILVKGNSGLLQWIKVGDRLNMKYYSKDSIYPYQSLDTKIRYITRQNLERLRGHYLVGLEIMEGKDRGEIHWSYRSNAAQVFPFSNSVNE